jgi:hypothetical protein
MIKKLTTYQAEATQKAIEYKRAGKTQESLDVFRQAKAAEARVKALQAGGAPGDDLASFLGDMEKLMGRVNATTAKATPSPQPVVPSRSPQPNATSAAATPVAAAGASAQTDPKTILNGRWHDYKMACLAAKQKGDNAEAVRLLQESKRCKAGIDALDAGNKVDMSTMPPPLSNAAASAPVPTLHITSAPTKATPTPVAAKAAAAPPVVAAKAAEAKNQVKTPTATPAKAASAPPAVPPRPSLVTQSSSSSLTSGGSGAIGLSVRDDVTYEDLIGKMNAQIDQLKTLMDQTYVGDDADIGPAPVKGGRAALEHAAKLKAAEPTKAQKQAALQYFRYKKTSTQQRDLLLAARRRGIRPPAYHTEKVTFDFELRHDDVKEFELDLCVKSGRVCHCYSYLCF